MAFVRIMYRLFEGASVGERVVGGGWWFFWFVFGRVFGQGIDCASGKGLLGETALRGFLFSVLLVGLVRGRWAGARREPCRLQNIDRINWDLQRAVHNQYIRVGQIYCMWGVNAHSRIPLMHPWVAQQRCVIL